MALVESLHENDRESLASVRMEVCRYLVEVLKFDVNSVSSPELGMTPLISAVSEGQVAAVRYLLDKGADPNKQDHEGYAPLHDAAKGGFDEIARLLLSGGAIVDISSSEGTPLHAAAAFGKIGVMQILLEHHADGQESDEDSNIQQNLHDESAVREDAGASGACTKDKLSDEDRKAQLKLHGGKAVAQKDYAGAKKCYTEAIMLDPADATLFSNRSLCHLKIGEKEDALVDANTCISLRPEWPKGYYRKGAAHMSLKEYKEARDAFLDGLKLDPSNLDIQNAY